MELVVFTLGLLVVAGLAFYAGKLLFQLKSQKSRQDNARKARVATIMESVHTIALAVEQQQCNLSEGAIRLVNLLDSVPVDSPPNCQRDYPSLYALFSEVRNLPTHEERNALDKSVRAAQDKIREEHESNLESSILKEIAQIRALSFD